MIFMRTIFGKRIEVDLKNIFIYPYLLAVFPILSLYIQNIKIVPVTEIIFVIFFQLALMTILIFLFNKVTNNKRKSSLIASVFIILFFSYGHSIYIASYILITIINLDLREFFLSQSSSSMGLLLFILTIIFSVFFYVIYRIKSELKFATLFMNISSLILISIMIYQSSISLINQNKFSEDIGRLEKLFLNIGYQVESPPANISTENLPNIYYIILDGYGRGDILRDLYNYDNREFYENLINNDFYLASSSNSNYSITTLSLASSLNFEYLDWAIDPDLSESINTFPAIFYLQNNKIVEILKEIGYTTISFETGYYPTELLNFDQFHSSDTILTPFRNGIINLTPLRYWLFRYQFDSHRKRINFIYDNIPALNYSEQPIFVFAHIISPHPPFVFKSNGEINNLDIEFNLGDGSHITEIKGEDFYIENYRNQLIYTNKRIQEIIDKIQSDPNNKSIIIVQSDHGPGAMLDWNSIDNSNIKERMGILNAYYFPDQDYSKLYSDITPVNSFRVILDQYLETDFGLLDDRNYFSLIIKPYEFIDVTEELNQVK